MIKLKKLMAEIYGTPAFEPSDKGSMGAHPKWSDLSADEIQDYIDANPTSLWGRSLSTAEMVRDSKREKKYSHGDWKSGATGEMSGYYLMKQLNDLAQDAERSEEHDLADAYEWLHGRINQSYRDIDLNIVDIQDLLNEPAGRKHSSNLPIETLEALFDF